jgi:hypothetical protein
MSRVRLIVSVAVVAMSAALAGCSGSSASWMPDWLTPKPAPPPLQTLQFESDPPGASVHTAQGQTCQTPCALAVPPQSQPITFSKNGFLPQTVQVSVGDIPEHSFFESAPPPTLTPNPVEAALQPAGPPPRPIVRPKPHRPVAPPPPPQSPSPFPPPPGQ